MSPPFRSPESIYVEAAELEGLEQERFLAAACAGDDALRREVERLRQAESAADGAIRRAIEVEAGRAAGRRHIGPYRVIRQLGQGGMGTVYLAARDDDEFEKVVAIKVARAAVGLADGGARFRHERQILARLEHPFIARLLDGGATQDGEPYLVMEYVDGLPVTRYAAEHKLDVRTTLELILKVASAVEYAHRHLVVHRDLKPSNIVVDAQGDPRLLDFGIAKILDGEQPRTVTRAQVLTPEYASPEQLRGDPVSVATDVYSLGLVACELLTGRAVRDEAERLPGRLRGDIESILRKARAPGAVDRYGSIREFADDIGRFLEGRPIVARPATWYYRASKFVVRNRSLAATAALLAASVVAGWWTTAGQARQTELRFAQVRHLTNVILFDVHDRIRDLPGSTEARVKLVETSRSYLASLRGSALRDVALAAEVAAGYERLGDVQGGVDTASAGRLGVALDSYREALALRERLAGAGTAAALRDLARVRVKWANATAHSGASSEAVRMLESAAAAAAEAWRLEPVAASGEVLMEAEYRIGDWLLRGGRAHDALPHFRQGVTIAAEVVGSGQPRRLSMAHRRLGEASLQAGRLTEASRQFALAVTVRSGEFDREAMLLEVAQGNVLGNPFFPNLGRAREAEAHYRRALEWAREQVRRDPANADGRNDLGMVLSRLGMTLSERDPVEAVALFDESIPIRAERLRVAPESVESLRVLAYVLATSADPLRRMGRAAEAESRLRRAMAMDEEMTRRDPARVECCSDIPLYAQLMGQAQWALGRQQDALASYRTAWAVAARYGVRETCGIFCALDWATSLESLARWHAAMGQPAPAREFARQSHDVWQGWIRRHGSNEFIEKKLASLGSFPR